MKQVKIIAAVLLIFALSAGTVFAGTTAQTVNLTTGQSTAQINGKDVTMAAPAQVVSGRTLVPLRFVGEAFGCDVQWINDTKTAVVTMEDQTIEVPIGQNYVMINGEKTDVEVPGQLINGSTYVPLRFIGENLGAKVDYDASSHGISIQLNHYQSESLGIGMVLPEGWSFTDETADGIDLLYGTDCAATINIVDNQDGAVTAENFNLFADECFKEFSDKQDYVSEIQDNGIAYGYYTEDGLSYVIGYKLLEKNIAYIVIGIPTESVDDSFAAKGDILFNTLSGK